MNKEFDKEEEVKMDTSYYRLAGEHPEIPGLRQVVLNEYAAIEHQILYWRGAAGGYIDPETVVLADGAWVMEGSIITGLSTVTGDRTLISGNSTVDDSTLHQARISNSFVEDSKVTDSSLSGVRTLSSDIRNSCLSAGGGRLALLDSTITGVTMDDCTGSVENTTMSGIYRFVGLDLGGIAYGELTDVRHFMSIGPVGSEDRTFTVWRGRGGTVRAQIGCWDGWLSGVMDEVHRRRRTIWDRYDKYSEESKAAWIEDYEAAVALCTVRSKGWFGGGVSDF